MKIWKSILVGATLVGCAAFGVAAESGGDDAAIRAHYAAVTQALGKSDAVAAMADYAPDVVVFDLGPPLSVIGHEGSVENYRVAFDATKGPWVCDWSNIHVTVDTKYAFATAFVHLGYTLKSGQKFDLHTRVTNVFEKRDGKWLVVHEHASLPTDLATAKAVVNAPEVGKGKQFNSPWK